MFRGYRGDSADGSGVTAQQMSRAATLLGWTPEIVAIAGVNSSSSIGLSQHIMLRIRAWPKNVTGSLHVGATSPGSTIPGTSQTYTQYWQSQADSIIASSYNTSQLTIGPMWEGSGGGGWGGMRDNNGIDPGTGSANSPTDWKNFFHNLVTTMRARGLSSAVTVDWNIYTSGLTTAQMDALYPGDDVVDFVGWDCYSGNYLSAQYAPKNNYDALWFGGANPLGGSTIRGQLSDFQQVTNYARSKGKRAGAAEFGHITLPPSDSRNGGTGDYTIADTDKYFKYMAQFVTANADVWAYVILWNENQHSVFSYDGSYPITEDDQLVYFGTNPATQTYPYLFSSNNAGTAYLTSSTNHTLSAPAWKQWFQSGTLQIVSAPITPTIGTYDVVKQKPRTVGSVFG
jgi:hypothetical protein